MTQFKLTPLNQHREILPKHEIFMWKDEVRDKLDWLKKYYKEKVSATVLPHLGGPAGSVIYHLSSDSPTREDCLKMAADYWLRTYKVSVDKMLPTIERID